MNDNDNDKQHDPYTFPVMFVMVCFALLFILAASFVAGWGVAMGLMFAGVL